MHSGTQMSNNYSLEQRQIAAQCRELHNNRNWDDCLQSLRVLLHQLPSDSRVSLNMHMVASASGTRNIELYELTLYNALSSCRLIDPDKPDVMQMPPADADNFNFSLSWLVHVYNYALIQFLNGRYARTRGLISRAILFVHAVPFSLAMKMGVLLVETYIRLAQPRRAADIIAQMQAYVRTCEAAAGNLSLSNFTPDAGGGDRQNQRTKQLQYEITVARARLDWLEARTYVMLRMLSKASRKLSAIDMPNGGLDKNQQLAGFRSGSSMPASQLQQYTMDNEHKLSSSYVKFNGRFFHESILQMKLMSPKLSSAQQLGSSQPQHSLLSPTTPQQSSVVADLFSPHQSRSKLDESMTAVLLNNLGCLYASVSANTTAMLQLTTALEFNERCVKRYDVLKSQSPFMPTGVGSPSLMRNNASSALSGDNSPLQIRSRDLRARIMFNLAHVLLRVGQHKMAFERFRELVQWYPQNPYIWLGLADCIIGNYRSTYTDSFNRHKPCRHLVLVRVGDGVHRKLVLSPSLTNNPKDLEQYFTPMAKFSATAIGNSSAASSSSAAGSSSGSAMSSCTKPEMSMEFGAICADNAKLCIRRLFGEPKPNKIVESDGMFAQLEASGAASHLRNAYYPLYPAANVPVSLLIRLRYRAIMTASFFNLQVGDYRTVVVDMSNMLRFHDLPNTTRLTCHIYVAFALAWLNDFQGAMTHLSPQMMKVITRENLTEKVIAQLKRYNDEHVQYSLHSGDSQALPLVRIAARLSASNASNIDAVLAEATSSISISDSSRDNGNNEAAAAGSPSSPSFLTQLPIPSVSVGLLHDGIQLRPPAQKLPAQPPVIRSDSIVDEVQAQNNKLLLEANKLAGDSKEKTDAAKNEAANDSSSAANRPNTLQSADESSSDGNDTFPHTGFAFPARALVMKYNLACLYALQKDYETADKLVLEVIDNLCRSTCFNSYLYARCIQLRIYLYLVRDRRNDALQLIKRECPQYRDRSWEIFVEDEKNVRRVFESAGQEYKY